MVKRIHEVWECSNCTAMFRRGAKGWRETLGPDARLIHTFEAESSVEAFRTYNRLMGWGEWNPPEGLSDTPYTDTPD